MYQNALQNSFAVGMIRATSTGNVMILNQKQEEVKDLIERVCKAINFSKNWPLAIAMTESSLGLKQDDEIIDVLCGIAFIYLLMKRWGTWKGVVDHFCDPKDRDFYWNRVNGYINQYLQENQ